jgi:uncharacterized protein
VSTAGVLFLDTAGWLAALSPRERHHDAAREAYVDAVRRGALLVTTMLVVSEMHALILRWRGISAAAYFLETVVESGSHHIVPVDEEVVQAALTRWIRRFQDKAFSLTDAVSFEIMRRERIGQALTLDRHFHDAGFQMVPAGG